MEILLWTCSIPRVCSGDNFQGEQSIQRTNYRLVLMELREVAVFQYDYCI